MQPINHKVLKKIKEEGLRGHLDTQMKTQQAKVLVNKENYGPTNNYPYILTIFWYYLAKYNKQV